MWNLTPLTNRLKIEGYNVHLETSGHIHFLEALIGYACLQKSKVSL